MSKRKLDHLPNPTPKPQKQVDRGEFDAQLKKVLNHVQKDPKKAAKIFESWLDKGAKNSTKKRAA